MTELHPLARQQAAGQTSSNSMSSQVELSISCSELANCDVVSKSDPQVIVYALDVTGKNKLFEIGRTEVIQDNLNPKFVKKIIMHYHFEQMQRMRFEVQDIDPIGGDDFLGSLDTTLADIVTSRSSTFKQPLKNVPKGKTSYLVVDVEELSICKDLINYDLKAQDLPASFCGLLAPTTIVNLYKSNENGTLTIVDRSKIISSRCDPQFGSFQHKLVSLCNGDLERSIRFELIDCRFNMDRNLGFVDATINSLLKATNQTNSTAAVTTDNTNQEFSLVSKKGNSYTTMPSKLVFNNIRLVKQASFLDYIMSGTQIHFVISIDFTASNGSPSNLDSLHYLDSFKQRLNPYEQCLLSVGNILKPYDSQGLFAGFGFGARLFTANGQSQNTSHLFPLNGNEQHPYVSTVDELLQVYRSKLSQVDLSGPTNFAPGISHCARIARNFAQDGKHYFILLIVTDGIISDMMQTKKAIIEASQCPMSIIICGVGDADFSQMDDLDSDDAVMQVDGKSAERDIVQFVPMNRYLPRNAGGGNLLNQEKSLEFQGQLAEEVLREIPDQLNAYMQARGFQPSKTSNDT